jgi:hypothetical protein
VDAINHDLNEFRSLKESNGSAFVMTSDELLPLLVFVIVSCLSLCVCSLFFLMFVKGAMQRFKFDCSFALCGNVHLFQCPDVGTWILLGVVQCVLDSDDEVSIAAKESSRAIPRISFLVRREEEKQIAVRKKKVRFVAILWFPQMFVVAKVIRFKTWLRLQLCQEPFLFLEN